MTVNSVNATDTDVHELWANGELHYIPKQLSRYNKFIRDEIARIKAANPSLEHKEAFTMAAKNWKPQHVSSPRQPSAYNTFMRDEIARVKAAHPHLSHKEAFTMAAMNWNK